MHMHVGTFVPLVARDWSDLVRPNPHLSGLTQAPSLDTMIFIFAISSCSGHERSSKLHSHSDITSDLHSTVLNTHPLLPPQRDVDGSDTSPGKARGLGHLSKHHHRFVSRARQNFERTFSYNAESAWVLGNVSRRLRLSSTTPLLIPPRTKTYKNYFTRWGLQKNFRSKQVAEILHQKTARDAAGKPSKILIRGKEDPEKSLKTYIRRTKKLQIQKDAMELDITATPDLSHDIMPVILCRTPSPVPPSSPQTALLASNSPPLWNDYIQRESMLFFEMHSFPRMHSSSTPDIPELWGSFQDSIPISAEQDISESTTSIGAFGQPEPNRSALSCRKPSPASAISHLFPLAMPDALGKPEECIYLVREYVTERFDSGSWTSENFFNGLNEVVAWYNLANSAVNLLRDGRTEQSSRISERSFHQFKTLLEKPNFELLFDTCEHFIRLSKINPDLATAFIKNARDASQFTLPNTHPFRRLLEKMYLMDVMELRQSLRSLLDSYHEFLENNVEPGSEFSIALSVSLCVADSILEWGGLLDTGVTEAHIKSSLKAVEQYGDLGRAEILDIKYYLADLYYYNNRYDGARTIISEILASTDTENRYDLSIMVDCYRLLSWISLKVESHEEIVASMNQWMSFIKTHFGYGDKYIDALSVWEAYLREINDIELADKTFEDLDTAVEELCVDFEEFLILDEDEDGSSDDV